MTEKANLVEIFKNLKSRRLKLLRFIRRERSEDNIPIIAAHADDLTILLSELKANEEHLIELSSELLKSRRVKNSMFKDFVQSSLSEIKSSLHWLDVISAHYRRYQTG